MGWVPEVCEIKRDVAAMPRKEVADGAPHLVLRAEGEFADPDSNRTKGPGPWDGPDLVSPAAGG